MTSLCSDVVNALRTQGKTISTAESLTGGGIGAALTAVPGASSVFKGGIVSYADRVKEQVLGVSREILERCGAVSAPAAQAMSGGVRKLLDTDLAVSVTGLAGPGGDEFGHSVGTVFIGYSDPEKSLVREYRFAGSREEVRSQTIRAALCLVLENL